MSTSPPNQTPIVELKPQTLGAEAAPQSPESGSSNGSGPGWVGTTLLAITVSALALVAYERLIRDPRTPRLGTIDVAELFALNQAKVLKEALGSGSTANLDPGTLGQKAATAMSDQIQAFTKQCNCLLIASPAVYGATAAITDFTKTIKEANGLTTSLGDLAAIGAPVAPVAPGGETSSQQGLTLPSTR
ncbi:MAG: hypothetical protein ACK4F8_11795 [Aquabacterium sp.]